MDTKIGRLHSSGPLLNPTDPSPRYDIEQVRQMLPQLIDGLIDAVLVVDRGQRVVAANRSYLETFGTGAEAVVGISCHDSVACPLSHPGSPASACPACDVLAHRHPRKIVLAIPDANGGQRRWEASLNPVLDARGEVSHVVEVWRDITDRSQLEGQLAHSERLASLGVLAAGIAHEINNPLAAILAGVESLKRWLGRARGLDSEEFRDVSEVLDILERQTQRGREITDKLLLLAQPYSGASTWVDVNRAGRDTLALLDYQLRKQNVTVDSRGAAHASPWSCPTTEPEARVAEITLLLVDDEESFRKLVSKELERAGYRVSGAGSLDEARRLLVKQAFHLVLLDVRLPDGSGLDLLGEIKESAPQTEVLMLTAYGTIEEAIRAMKLGALDFLTKPCKLAELEAVLEKAFQRQNLQRSHTALEREVERLQPTERFIGSTPQIRELLDMVARVADTDSTVLIRGESGAGKELVARAVHRQSRRSRQPFVVVDCASLHENLLQSELFGHEKGAYTGAIRLKHGLFEVADRGTIFLDEIGELTPQLQVKLLRVLETGVFRRVGGTADIKVDVRVIAATNRSLEQMMKEGHFREDLYYRLNVFSLHIPPLRERRDDVPVLAEHFIRNSSIAPKRSTRISEAAMSVLRRYAWPGNVRELENLIERALILCDGGVLEPDHLPMGVRVTPQFTQDDESGRLPTLEEVELRYIRRVLEECKGHRHKAASILGISERNLYRRLKELEAEQAASS